MHLPSAVLTHRGMVVPPRQKYHPTAAAAAVAPWTSPARRPTCSLSGRLPQAAVGGVEAACHRHWTDVAAVEVEVVHQRRDQAEVAAAEQAQPRPAVAAEEQKAGLAVGVAAAWWPGVEAAHWDPEVVARQCQPPSTLDR